MVETVTKKLMLYFPQCECEKPIIYHLVKDHNLLVNVYRAKVTPSEEGYLVLDVTGAEEDIERAIDFVRTFDVTINPTGKGVIWDAVRCTHCGHCVVHCPTDALDIANDTTREIAYDESKCVECLKCIRVCPYEALNSAF
jgi:L-aspartate semialdehyde sulfurtransferase ferredoxin